MEQLEFGIGTSGSAGDEHPSEEQALWKKWKKENFNNMEFKNVFTSILRK